MRADDTSSQISLAPDGTPFPLPDAAALGIDLEELTRFAQRHRAAGRSIVAVQGLGFVGAAVAAVLAGTLRKDGTPRHAVLGVDLANPASYWKVALLKEGKTPVNCSDPQLAEWTRRAVCQQHNLLATTQPAAFAAADVMVVAIPLDVENRTALAPEEIRLNLAGFTAAMRTLGKHMQPDALVLVETTVPIGTCRQIVEQTLREERARRGIHTPLYLAHAYERVMPGPNYVKSIQEFWRSFAGIDHESAERARRFLESFIATDAYPPAELAEPESTELAKLLENSYRAVNIAFIHEWTLLAEQVGVDLFRIVDSVRVRKGTHDNMRYPGFGVGGYCLTKDSLLAQWAALHHFDGETRLGMTLEALRINYLMPLHTLKLLRELLGETLAGRTIAVLGVCYLPDVADARNSPTELFVDELATAGARVIVHDPLLRVWQERPAVAFEPELPVCLKQADGVVFAVPHRLYREMRPELLADALGAGAVLVDGQNVLADATAEYLHKQGHRLLGVGKGHWRKRGYQCARS